MVPRHPTRLAACITIACAGLTIEAGADVVTFTSGTRLHVDAVRDEGDVVVLVLRGGQEVRTAKALVADVVPDAGRWDRTAALAALAASPAATTPPAAGVIRALVDRIAGRVGLDARLAHAVVRYESNYDPLAVSPAGAMGLMQITSPVAMAYGARDPFDPEQNLEAGLRHLRRLLQRFDLRRALAAYNAGEGAVDRHGGVPPYAETQTYVHRILAAIRPTP